MYVMNNEHTNANNKIDLVMLAFCWKLLYIIWFYLLYRSALLLFLKKKPCVTYNVITGTSCDYLHLCTLIKFINHSMFYDYIKICFIQIFVNGPILSELDYTSVPDTYVCCFLHSNCIWITIKLFKRILFWSEYINDPVLGWFDRVRYHCNSKVKKNKQQQQIHQL